jgi:hypothetical protein
VAIPRADAGEPSFHWFRPTFQGMTVPMGARPFSFGTLAWVVLLASTCTPATVLEEGAAACSNGLDDDDDGLADCDDPACGTTDACELTAAACANGIDEDRDGDTDCEDGSCVDAGLCAAYAASCSVVPQAGCTAGMGCYTVGADERECRLAGAGAFDAECQAVAADGRHPCAASFDCYNQSCTSFCLSDAQCPRESLCILAPEIVDFGICSIPCDRVLHLGDESCREGLSCTSGHLFEASFDDWGALWFCLPPTNLHADAAGGLGDPCDDPPSPESVPTRVCPADFACAPDATGATACRKLCDVNDENRVVLGCAQDEDCVVLHPFDDRPAEPFDVARLGACLPR